MEKNRDRYTRTINNQYIEPSKLEHLIDETITYGENTENYEKDSINSKSKTKIYELVTAGINTLPLIGILGGLIYLAYRISEN